VDKVIMKYNPAFLSPEELVASFVVREGELETIMRIIKENVTKSNQHILVIGPRGIGKTMLVLRTAEEIRRDKELGEKWYPLVFSEESYQVSTCGEFWLESLFHLGQQTKDERWQQTYEELREEKNVKRLSERALAQLMDFADKQGKRILLVVENLNMLLGDQLSDEDGWALRHTFLNEPRVMLLASAVSRFEQVEVEGKPMFELFRFLELKPLDEQECRLLWASVTGKDVADARVRPLQILTGGNPRLLTIVASFAANMSLKNLMKDLIRLVDEHTEYFKCHLDNLPATERKVYLALAEVWDPATARQVAKVARLEVSKTSALLGRLIERGAVVEANGKAHSKLYQIAERMYNIYYLMRHQGAPSGRVRAVVNFVVSFYELKELVTVAKCIAEEACQLALADRGDHYMAYEGVVSQIGNKSLVYRIIGSTPRDFFEGTAVPIYLKKVFETFEEREPTRRIFDLYEKSESIRNNPKELEKEQRYFRDFVRKHPQNYGGLIGLGIFLHVFMNRFDEVEKILREATQIAPKRHPAWLGLGLVLTELGRFEETETIFSNLTDMSPKEMSTLWVMFGRESQKHGRLDITERAYRKAVEINPKDKIAWFELGTLLGRDLERYAESANALKKMVNLDPKNAGAWHNLGLTLQESGKFEEAEKAYRKVIKLEKKPAQTWGLLGNLLLQTDRINESEQCFRKAIELDKKQYIASLSLILIMAADASRREEWQGLLKELVKNTEAVEENVAFATIMLIAIAVCGYEREVLEILRESPWAEALEPVVVALRLRLGEDVKAAAEIMEVAKDVVKRIEEGRKQIEDEKKK
jgi:tetratricopeptide (TPR) repeat protein